MRDTMKSKNTGRGEGDEEEGEEEGEEGKGPAAATVAADSSALALVRIGCDRIIPEWGISIIFSFFIYGRLGQSVCSRRFCLPAVRWHAGCVIRQTPSKVGHSNLDGRTTHVYNPCVVSSCCLENCFLFFVLPNTQNYGAHRQSFFFFAMCESRGYLLSWCSSCGQGIFSLSTFFHSARCSDASMVV